MPLGIFIVLIVNKRYKYMLSFHFIYPIKIFTAYLSSMCVINGFNTIPLKVFRGRAEWRPPVEVLRVHDWAWSTRTKLFGYLQELQSCLWYKGTYNIIYYRVMYALANMFGLCQHLVLNLHGLCGFNPHNLDQISHFLSHFNFF